MIKWFAANKLNLDKRSVMKFITRIHQFYDMYWLKKKYIYSRYSKYKFFGLQIDNHLNWKNHIEQMIPKLSGDCCAVRLMVHINNINTLKSVYYPDQQMHTIYEVC